MTQPDVPPRALAPDLARGLMLLLIVLANIPWFLWGQEHGVSLGHPVGATGIDRVVQTLMIIVVDARALPMFALLFGYGMVQFARAQEARGTPIGRFRAMLRRRHLALLAFGAVHAALLFYGDVLGVYGLLGLILTPILFLRSTRAIRVVRAVMLVLLVLFALLSVAGGYLASQEQDAVGEAMLVPGNVNEIGSWTASVLPRLGQWAAITAFAIFVLSVPAAMLTGWIWARKGLLDRPQEHLPTLRRIALICLPIAWVGGIPMMLVHTGWLWTPELGWGMTGLHTLTGLVGGMGYAALFGLLAARVGASPGPVARSVGAVGRRSLSAYLWQALIMAPLLAAWGFGLGGTIGSAAAAGIAVLIWAASVLWCTALERAGRRGPAEVLLRRLTYGSRGLPSGGQPTGSASANVEVSMTNRNSTSPSTTRS